MQVKSIARDHFAILSTFINLPFVVKTLFCLLLSGRLNDFSNRWCKRENVEPDALKEWKINIFAPILTFFILVVHHLSQVRRLPFDKSDV